MGMKLDRRDVIMGMSAMAATISAPRVESRTAAFGYTVVVELARRAAQKPYQPPVTTLPSGLAALSYDDYRRIQYEHLNALWARDDLGFRLEFFHRGSLYKERVELFEIRDGQPRAIVYAPEQFQFRFGDRPAPKYPADTGYAGFRIVAQNGTSLDEIAAFLGASYYRAVGRGERYGLSARGLAIGTGSAKGEEFPLFRSFWIERPGRGDASLRVHALLDSPSVAGAYSFRITPGTTTGVEVDMTLFPRRVIDDIGIAPLTSMYLFNATDRGRFDDFRGAVHDSDGLQIANGAGEHLWRPLSNPVHIQESAFADHNPKSFGLMQRDTRFADYDDSEARYDQRPSVRVTPANDWGAGAVHLFELPSQSEGNDNIVAFWRPDAPLRPNQSHTYRYHMDWGPPEASAQTGQASQGCVIQTRTGRALNEAGRVFVIDYALPAATDVARLTPTVTTSAGQVGAVSLQPAETLPSTDSLNSVRVSFHFMPADAQSADVRLDLRQDGVAIAETWIFRWTL